MTSADAKKILLRCRPGSVDANEPEVAEALAVATRDPELQQWLEEQNRFQRAVRLNFRRAPVPDGLRQRLLLQTRTVKVNFRRAWFVRLAAAAALVFLIGWVVWQGNSSGGETLEIFRSRMVRTVLRQYTMDLTTNDKTQVRDFLAGKGAPADYVLPPRLDRLPVLGAGVLRWQGEPVSMICLDSGAHGTLFLFVVNRESIARAPGPTPEFTQVNKLMTASWTDGSRTYVLAGSGGRAALELQNGPGK